MAKVETITADSVISEGVSKPTNPPAFDFSALSTMEQLEMVHRQKQAVEKLSFEDALKSAVIAESDVEVINKEKKDSLIGVDFIIVGVRVSQGNFGPFVTLTAVTEDDKNIVINDGSTGIASQMFELVQKFGVDQPIRIKNGLRKSVYYVDKDSLKVVGKEPQPNSFPATTYYLDI